MREIKFKAWDRTNSEWYMDGESFDLNYSGRYGVFFFDNDHPCNIREVKLIWCQFTGLVDKNGNEIYEGYRINDHIGTGVVKYSDKYGAFRTVYGDGRAKWFYDYCLKGERESIEIIGNIYENPQED